MGAVKSRMSKGAALKLVPPEGLAPEEIQELQDLLLEQRRSLLGDMQSIEQERSGGGGSLSNLPDHMADRASDSAEDDMSLERVASASGEIQEIDAALERIRDGSYGRCETCEKPIPVERLRAIPHARLCIPCKMEEEGQ